MAKRLTIEEMQSLASQRGGRSLSKVYVDNRTPLEWECSKGHIWQARPCNIKTGGWCPYCTRNAAAKLGIEGLLERCRRVAEERDGKCLSNNYLTARKLLEWQCSDGHTWDATFSSLYHGGSWCPTCSRHLGERLTRNVFETLFGYKFPTSRPRWLRSETGAQLSLDGYCEVLELAFEHQGEQHYSPGNYFGNTAEEQKKIRLYDQLKRRLCKQHGTDLILLPEVPHLTPLDALVQFVITACRAVGKEPPSPSKPVCFEQAYIEDGRLHRLREAAKARGGDLAENTYFGMRHRYTWRCAEGHEWLQTAKTVVNRGTWCPYCSGRHNITLHLLQEKAYEKGGEILSSDYHNRDQKILCRCKCGHVFQRVARNIITGSWCPKCEREPLEQKGAELIGAANRRERAPASG